MNAPRPIPKLALRLAVPLMLLPGAAGAGYAPLDDFEAGPFSFSGSTNAPVPIPGYSSHAYWMERNISMNNGLASLSVSPLFDDAMYLSIGSGDFCRVEYLWGTPRDLSFAGSVERIDVRIAGIPGTGVGAAVTNGTSTAGVPAQILPAPGQVTLSFPIAQWASSLTSVATGFWISFSDPGEYMIYDIRFVTAGSNPVDFTGGFTATQIPPVPSSPLQFTALDQLANPLYAADVAIVNAVTDAQTVPGGDWTWSSMSSLGGDVATLSFQWTDFGGVLETEFDLSVDLSATDSWFPDLYPPDPIHAPESFALSFPVAMRTTANGSVGGVSNTWLTFDFDDRQLGSLEFWDVTVTGNPSPLTSWADGFTLHFRMALSGLNTPDEQYPLFHATWTSDWTTLVPTAAPAAPSGSADRIRLVPAPSVTRGGTVIRASRPLGPGATVAIHDVTGRVVKRLRAAAGASSVRWDGRAEHGRPTAAGVYFVTLESGAGAEPARVVRVR